MIIHKVVLPEKSILNTPHVKYDYVDSFQGVVLDPKQEFTSFDVGKAFFTSSPRWVEKLFALRNKIVALFGLKTSGKIDNRQSQLDHFRCEPGEQMGLFKVFARTANEVILGEDDKHLNFRVSLFLGDPETGSERALTISTTVEFNNWLGRLYFLPVRPFHKLIVPTMLKGIIKQLNSK